MIENMLGSKVKIMIAKFLAEKGGELQVSDIARMLKISKSRASECLRDLSEKGLLESRAVGKSLLYRRASNSLAKAVFRAVTEEKTFFGEIEKDVLRETKAFRPVSLVLFGSALKGLKIGSDIDFLLLYRGRVEKERVYDIVARLSEKFGLHISILPMSVGEFRTKAKMGEEFALNVLANNRLIYGKELEKVVWQE